MIKIVHTADTHLGYRQYQSDIRKQDFFDSFAYVTKSAVELNADAVVHAGDLFDSRNPSLEDLVATIAILQPLKTAGIPFLGIVGNHEGKQNTQWLDLFEGMGLAKRLSEKPHIISKDDVSAFVYGMDNLSHPRLSAFDFSVFEAEKAGIGDAENSNTSATNEPIHTYNLLVLHQLLSPVLPMQPMCCDDFLDNIPIPFDAVLLGDNHKYECVKYKDCWATYPGSTERCSASEDENRSFNLLTLDENELSITRYMIPTRDFVTVSVPYGGDQSDYLKTVYAKIDEYSQKIPDAVVFVELLGLKKTLISISEIEEYVLEKGALVVKVGDRRDRYDEEPERLSNITFQDPDDVVNQTIRTLNLTGAGFLLDNIVRSKEISKSSVDEESENSLKAYLESVDFSEESRRENHIRPENFIQPETKTKAESEMEKEIKTEQKKEPEKEKTQEKEQKEKDKEKKPGQKPKQYTLGDMFG
ncbi:exonuclease SbcCD subunit D [Methanolapillus millepedarum]|uniref:DNA double-strand break repair protein Mre11 n=1 Tax=Methanolapillus millepedarum TaxID=3028296 RepID=A0AA96V3K8_9EURY|nr:hypothetical protein MsAc7_15310 [Methanosarcinaceae archaeon Ac7]